MLGDVRFGGRRRGDESAVQVVRRFCHAATLWRGEWCLCSRGYSVNEDTACASEGSWKRS